MSESFDRATTLGFRCVKDTSESAAGPYHIHEKRDKLPYIELLKDTYFALN